MPKLNPEDVRRLIVKKEVVAIALDTSVLESFSRSGDLQHAKLLGLYELEAHDIQVLMPDVVLRELRAHMTDDLEKTHERLMNALKNHSKRWEPNREAIEAFRKTLVPKDRAQQIVSERLAMFLRGTGAIVLMSEKLSSPEKILDLYFGQRPPFGLGKNKSEFPDAFALCSIESWSAECGGVIVVSNDTAWREFCERSPNLYCMSELREALAAFNQDVELLEAFIERFNSEPNLSAKIQAVLQETLSALDFEVSIKCDLVALAVPEAADITSIELYTGDIAMISSDEDELVFVVEIPTQIDVRAAVYLYGRDYDTNEQTFIGSATVPWNVEHTFEVTISLSNLRAENPTMQFAVSPDHRLEYAFLGEHSGVDLLNSD
ncbi:PIN domain-containing protein [Rhizobium sp. GN54]|uniref:PIN domain-containing protein n=1 Tax=Rhizobium sp. GN54 TaxID=2898150 RepID=UPI001E50234F|nr:PIN domain-containing protein [Rhizobium sp. GN54]MCD2185217.1 PIN domain-containing protein [Rhizobium sp. GN54]